MYGGLIKRLLEIVCFYEQWELLLYNFILSLRRKIRNEYLRFRSKNSGSDLKQRRNTKCALFRRILETLAKKTWKNGLSRIGKTFKYYQQNFVSR